MLIPARPNSCLLTCLICIHITFKLCYANVVLIPTPSQTIPIGKSLKLSCIVTNRKIPVMWRKDGRDIGEDCKPYNKNVFTCDMEKDGDTTTYNLKINTITSADAGNWSCSHGLHSVETIEINVAVPTKVHPLKVYPLLPQSGTSRSLVHGSSSLQSRQPVPLNGAGTLKHPIDLTTASSTDGPREWVVHCRSTCGSSARDLRWELLNKTWLGHLTLPNAPMLLNDCPFGQYRVRRNIIFSCLHDKYYGLGKRSQHALVGLNRLICIPNHGNLTELIEASHFRTGVDNTYFHWHRHYTSSLWPVNHRFSTAGGGGSAQEEEQFDCTAGTGELPFACVHILCPGNPSEWFTWGERVALVVSAVLFLMFCLFLCYLTRHRKQAKRRSNIAPGQQHEVEFML